MEALLEVGKQVPSLVVLAYMMILWVRSQEKRDLLLKGIGEQCHVVQRDAIKAMHANTEQGAKTEVVLEQVSKLLIKMNGSR